MNRETAKRLEDARLACKELLAFAHDRSERDLSEDRTFQLVVERLLTIIGEAINLALRDADGDLTIPEARNIVGLRNRLVHDYGAIRADIVWIVIQDDIPALLTYLNHRLDGIEE